MSAPERRSKKLLSSQSFIAIFIVAVSVAMLSLTFASGPLYRAFCSATGYGGTPQLAKAGSAAEGARELIVRFDANVAPGLAWTFAPEEPQVRLRTGQTTTIFYKVTNLSDRDTAARAAYNVSPENAGAYFDKISCFCFEEQKLGPHETAELPVVFFLDPALEKDEGMAGVQSVTLSYTFFAVKPSNALAAAKPAAGHDDRSP